MTIFKMRLLALDIINSSFSEYGRLRGLSINEHYFRNCLEKDFQIGQCKKKIEFGLPCGTAGGVIEGRGHKYF